MTMTTTNTQLPPEQKPEGETTSSKDRTFMFRAEVRGPLGNLSGSRNVR